MVVPTTLIAVFKANKFNHSDEFEYLENILVGLRSEEDRFQKLVWFKVLF